MDEGAAGDGCGEKEGGFCLGETQSGGRRGDHPSEHHDTQEQQGADGCDEWEGLGEGLGRGQRGKGLGGGGAGGTSGSGRTAEIAEKQEVDVGTADEGAEEVFELTQALGARDELVLERRKPQVKEGTEHRKAEDGVRRQLSVPSRRWRG